MPQRLLPGVERGMAVPSSRRMDTAPHPRRWWMDRYGVSLCRHAPHWNAELVAQPRHPVCDREAARPREEVVAGRSGDAKGRSDATRVPDSWEPDT